jgi:hypothetical protein
MTGIATAMVLGRLERPDGLGAGHRSRHHPAVQRRLVAEAGPGDGRGRDGRQPGHQRHDQRPGLSPGSTTPSSCWSQRAALEQVAIDVTLNVALPARSAGSAAPSPTPMTATRRRGDVTLHADYPPGTPLDIVATSDADGAYSIIGPAGTAADGIARTATCRSPGTSRSFRRSRRPVPTWRSTRSSRMPRSRATSSRHSCCRPVARSPGRSSWATPAATPTCTSPSVRWISVAARPRWPASPALARCPPGRTRTRARRVDSGRPRPGQLSRHA